jgi:hypothetical protein
MRDKKLALDRLRTTFIPFTDVWRYSPNRDRSPWDGSYEIKGSYVRPSYRNASFELELLANNRIQLDPRSTGIYVIKDTVSVIYVGLTEKNIRQRFNAHVSKLTAVSKWHHPVRWRKYAEDRYRYSPENLDTLSDFEIGFYSIYDFIDLLAGDSKKEQVDDMEALVFYGLCVTNPKERFLNTETSVSTKSCREKWRQFFS